MSGPHASFTFLAFAACVGLACTSAPNGGGGSGGSGDTGGSTSGGAHSGAGGVASTGGAEAESGGSGGSSSGGSENSGGGGLGGESASGGAEASGGDGGTGGSLADGYGPCDEALGYEDNPGCGATEVCIDRTCAELCPTDLAESVTYECPQASGGDAISSCAWLFGRCRLACEAQGGQTFTCPDGMTCEVGSCVWPE